MYYNSLAIDIIRFKLTLNDVNVDIFRFNSPLHNRLNKIFTNKISLANISWHAMIGKTKSWWIEDN